MRKLFCFSAPSYNGKKRKKAAKTPLCARRHRRSTP